MKQFAFFFSLLFSFIANAQTVTMGSQVWMDKNLESSTMQEGADKLALAPSVTKGGLNCRCIKE